MFRIELEVHRRYCTSVGATELEARIAHAALLRKVQKGFDEPIAYNDAEIERLKMLRATVTIDHVVYVGEGEDSKSAKLSLLTTLRSMNLPDTPELDAAIRSLEYDTL